MTPNDQALRPNHLLESQLNLGTLYTMSQAVNPSSPLLSKKFTQVKMAISSIKITVFYVIAVAVILILLLIAMANKALQDAPAAHIEISSEHLSPAQYQALSLAVSGAVSDNFFTADLQALRDLALSQQWIDQVSITRDWQRGIIISALPKQAVANFGTERLIDAKGSVFVPVESVDLMRAQFAMLQGDPAKSRVIMQQMQQINEWFSPLNMKVEDIILTPRMTWLVRFDNGIRLIVDNENTAQKLLSLSQLLNGSLASQLDEMQSIDLRYKNGFAIAWKMTAGDTGKPNAAKKAEDHIVFEGETDHTVG